jgi:hydroxymethylpyrimidine/phosphomethylpyrimidine kinase
LDAVRALGTDLFPMAELITPNIPEAEALIGWRIGSPEAMRRAARQLHEAYGCAVLLKGGHLRGIREAADILYDVKEEFLLATPRIRGMGTHGTGCTYAAAVTAGLAQGKALRTAVEQAKTYIARAIAGSRRVGKAWVLGWGR